MKTGMIGVAVLILLAAASPALGWNCSSICSCGRGPGFFYADCPRVRPTLTVRNEINSQIRVTCLDPTVDLTVLHNFDVGSVKLVSFKQCPLPQTNYSTFLESMGARDFSGLDICDSNLSATDLRDSLSNLDGVTALSLNNLGLTDVPVDFLKNVPQLRSLDLRFNALQFPLGIFDNLPNLYRLDIAMNRLGYLEPGLFRNLGKLYRLSMFANRLRNLTRETFTGANQLFGLDLNSNGIQELPENVFAELYNLKQLALEANNFTHLPRNLFRNMSTLEMIRMNDNRRALESLPPGLFANLTNLREAYLHRMYLSELPDDLFHGSRNLTNITLYGNYLRRLPEALFRDTTRLLTLDLSRNRLEHLPDKIFSALSELEYLNLSNNQLTEISELVFASLNSINKMFLQRNAITTVHPLAFWNQQKLQKLDMSRNNVSFIRSSNYDNRSPLTNCKNLEYLYLSNNSIDTVFEDWRYIMLGLKLVDLSYNKIPWIQVSDLTFMSRHVKLDLTYNKISTISLYGSEAIALNSIGSDGGAVKNVTVYLEGNPLHCNCLVYDFLRYIELKIAPEVHSMFDLKPGNLKCVSPPTYEGTLVSTISAEHFQCGCDDPDMQKDLRCPSGCDCCAKPFEKALIVDCSNAGLSRAPGELPSLRGRLLTQTQLLLQRNNLTALPNATQPGYDNVTYIDVSHNRLTALHVNQLPEKLTTLRLDNNKLTQLDKSVLSFLTNRTSVTLSGNPWTCSCNNRDFLTFLRSQFKQVTDLRNITCKSDNGTQLYLGRMTVDDLCPTDVVLIVILGVTIGTVGLLLGVIATLYYRYHQELKVWLYAHNLLLWWVTEDELDKDKVFDAFVSFSHKDEEFVVDELVPGLESGPKPFKLCLHFRDWIAGEFIPQQIARSVNESRRTLVVLSPNFLESVWGRMEFRAAHQQAMSEGRARVILLLYGDIGPVDDLDPELKAYISMNTYVKWGDPCFWDKLRYALPHRAPVKQKHYHINAATVSDKMDLMFPPLNVPAATTPPADSVNSLFIIEDKAAAAEKEAKLNGELVFADPSSGYIKCV